MDVVARLADAVALIPEVAVAAVFAEARLEAALEAGAAADLVVNREGSSNLVNQPPLTLVSPTILTKLW